MASTATKLEFGHCNPVLKNTISLCMVAADEHHKNALLAPDVPLLGGYQRHGPAGSKIDSWRTVLKHCVHMIEPLMSA